MTKLNKQFSKFKTVLLGTVLFASASSVFAHVQLESATPEINASVTTAPSKITLNFGDEVMLMSMKVIDSQKNSIPVDYSMDHSMKKSFDIPVTGLTQGKYMVGWAAMGKDGHHMKGTYTFSIESK
ncbi:copper resistance CopC family protein [Acinetobacter pollinis]|uniref:copper resistance CopC family protein n=1 Tax=Acinetobacter pollinis TaxID=2605270 RepID=UPI0018A263B5|nr:copper resistance CopC family protein [Acinetobacter pollinis]MBF7689805.1 copper resistance protein CopC [Acinetobacter pollinis]MBF7697343.1 copper resistance protein CopC [Acinetobacter pollinis]